MDILKDLKKDNLKKNKDILIIEDKYSLRMVYQSQLDRLNYSFDIVSSGLNMLETVEKNNYHLIVLDFGLPDMNGKEVCQKLRSEQSLGHTCTPILMCSASGNLLFQECLESGATDFFVKTVIGTKKFEEILSRYF